MLLVRGAGPRAESHQCDIPSGSRASQGSTFVDRDMTNVHATDFGRSAPTFLGPAG